MLLVADAGNTNIKLGIFEDETLKTITRMPTTSTKTPDAYGRAVLDFLCNNGISAQEIEAVIVTTVVPQSTQPFLTGMRQLFGLEPLVVDSGTKTGIVIKTDHPETLGADRLVNAAAAFQEHGGPLLVIDFGTATTYDVITDKAEFLGGVIAPGVRLCAEALWEKTARLPEVAIDKPEHVMGTDTVSSMQSGIFYGYLGQLEYFVRHLKKEQGLNLKVVATGGLSSIFAGNTDVIDIYDPDLTLKGLKYIYKINQRSPA